MKKFIIKTALILIVAVAVIEIVDLREYIAYDKKDGTGKVEEVQRENKNTVDNIENKIKSLKK